MTESLQLGPRVKAFKEEEDSNSLTLGPSLGDSVTNVRPDTKRLIDIFADVPLVILDLSTFLLKKKPSSNQLYSL